MQRNCNTVKLSMEREVKERMRDLKVSGSSFEDSILTIFSLSVACKHGFAFGPATAGCIKKCKTPNG